MKKYTTMLFVFLAGFSMGQAMEGQQENQSHPVNSSQFQTDIFEEQEALFLLDEDVGEMEERISSLNLSPVQEKPYLVQVLENLKPEEVKGFLSSEIWYHHDPFDELTGILDQVSLNENFYPSDRMRANFLKAERRYYKDTQSLTDEEAFTLFDGVRKSRDVLTLERDVAVLYMGKMVYQERAQALEIPEMMEILQNFVSTGNTRPSISGQMSIVIEGLEKKLNMDTIKKDNS